MRRPSSWHHLSNSWMWQNYHQWYNWCLLGNIKGAMSRPAHVQDFSLLCWFSQLSAILELGNQADFWQQTSVYSTFTVQFLLVYLSIFFVKFYCGYRRETMISDEATESVAVSFLRCRWGFFYEFVLFIHMLSVEIINCYLHGLFFRKIASRANAKALVQQNEWQIPIEDVLARVLDEHVAVNVLVDPWRSLAETRWVTLLVCGRQSWTWKGQFFFLHRSVPVSLWCK